MESPRVRRARQLKNKLWIFLCSQASPELAIEPATTLAKIF